jgi:hypothetical protein
LLIIYEMPLISLGPITAQDVLLNLGGGISLK